MTRFAAFLKLILGQSFGLYPSLYANSQR